MRKVNEFSSVIKALYKQKHESGNCYKILDTKSILVFVILSLFVENSSKRFFL